MNVDRQTSIIWLHSGQGNRMPCREPEGDIFLQYYLALNWCCLMEYAVLCLVKKSEWKEKEELKHSKTKLPQKQFVAHRISDLASVLLTQI